MNHHSVFVPGFLAVDPQVVSAEIRENGYYVFEEVLTSSFIDALVSDFECSDILENSTRILPHLIVTMKVTQVAKFLGTSTVRTT